jgi:cytochrome P450
MEYHPFDPDVIQHPYPIYARLRREAPVCRTSLGFAAVSRYDDVLEVLRDPQRFSSSAMGDLIRGVKALSPQDLGQGETLLGSDPPVHTRLRKIVNRGFTPRRIAELEPRIRAIARGLVARLAAGGVCDLVAALAVPLPVTVIAEILGIDAERRDDFKRWSEEILAAVAGAPAPELRARLQRSFLERAAYLEGVIEERKRHPREDVISALVRAEQEGGAMTEDEVGNFIVLLLVAGNETTTNLVGNALIAALADPHRLEAVALDPGLVPAWVEETLRFDSPVQLTFRRAREEVELGGEKIRQGELVGLLLGSANRDEGRFRDADRFELLRETNGHLAFGFGTHFCLGANLARLEARVALEALLSRFRRLELVDREIERVPSLLTRGPRALHVRCA